MPTNKLDAAVLLGVDNKGYFFEGNKYYRYTPEDQVDFGYPKPIRGNWENWPEDFLNGVDAAFYHPHDHKLYFFKGNRYLRHTYGIGCDRGYPKPIRGNWDNWPADFANGIDAAVFLPRNNKLYFFKGNQYIRHTFGTGCDRGYPKSIRGHWDNWPADFTNGIDAALFWTNGKLYFFKGEKFIRYTYDRGLDLGYPATIGPTNWDGIFGRYSSKRTIAGRITYRNTNQGVPGLMVKAWDADIDTADQMGETITDVNGNYLIRYEGKRWDASLPRSTAWRPDIVVAAFVKARDNLWSRVFKSRQYSNHKMANGLNVDVKIHPPDTVVERHTSFDPARNGFSFANDKFVVCAAPSCREEYWDKALAIFGDNEMANLIRDNFRDMARFHWALCGGMCLSALRRYNRRQSPPMPDFSPQLKEELIRCQFETLFAQHPQTWARILKWQARPDEPHRFPDDLGLALNTIGYKTIEEWGKLKRELDRRRPRIICLIEVGPTNDPKDASDNHQVVAIGYKQNLYNNEVEIFAYDPNYPGKTSRILLNTGLPKNQINAIQKTPDEDDKTVRGFFLVEVSAT